jgi:hypothetical protein
VVSRLALVRGVAENNNSINFVREPVSGASRRGFGCREATRTFRVNRAYAHVRLEELMAAAAPGL